MYSLSPLHIDSETSYIVNKTLASEWPQRLFMAFGTSFYSENQLEKLSKQYKKVRNWVSNLTKIVKN